VVEAVKLWNEPNNKSHWDFEVDADWRIFSEMVKQASAGIASENARLLRVLGGTSPIDPGFLTNLGQQGVLEAVDAVAIHGFPLDWNHWSIHEWPEQVASVRAVTDLPIWVTEVGVTSLGAEEVQVFGLRKSAERAA
jgi:beta-xylosidase